jgi:hypothetical protein
VRHPVGELMTTTILNEHNHLRGRLVRLEYGEPVVTYFGDRTEYLPGWRDIEVTSSDEYLLPAGRFEADLWVDPQGDVWRRKAVSAWGSPWPCEESTDAGLRSELPDGLAAGHTFEGRGSLCWHCGQAADTELSYEIFTLVSAEGFPAESARPQQRAEVEEWTGGPLLRVGSVEARARAAGARREEVPTASVTSWSWAVGVLLVMVIALVVVAVVHAA